MRVHAIPHAGLGHQEGRSVWQIDRPPGYFDFADRNSILFEWNEGVDEFPEGIVDVEDVVLYPSLAAEHPGVVLGRDQPLPSIEEELVPQG